MVLQNTVTSLYPAGKVNHFLFSSYNPLQLIYSRPTPFIFWQMQQYPVTFGAFMVHDGPFMNFEKGGIAGVRTGPNLDFIRQYDGTIIRGKLVPFQRERAAADADNDDQEDR